MRRCSFLQLAASSRSYAVAECSFPRSHILENHRGRPFSVNALDSQNAGQIITGAGPTAVWTHPAPTGLEDITPQDSGNTESVPEDRTRISNTNTPAIVLSQSRLNTNLAIPKHKNAQDLASFVPKTAYEVANLHGLQISRVPGGHDRPRLFGDKRSQENLRPDITFLKTSDMMRSGLERQFLALDEQVQNDLIQLGTHLADTFKEPGAVNLVWQRFAGLENSNLSLFLLVRIAIDRPRLFLRIICQLRSNQLELTMNASESSQLMRRVMCYIYCILMSRHVQMSLKMPAIYFEALQKVVAIDPSALKVLPRYSLYRHCPPSFQQQFSDALQRESLDQGHWEDYLISSQRCASEGDWSGVKLHLGNVYEICGKIGNFPVRSVEFINTVGRLVGYAKSHKSNVGDVINAILPATKIGEMQALVYSRLVRYALVENRPEGSNLELILSRLPPRALSRSALVDHLLNAIILLNTRPPDHRLNPHLKFLLRKNNVLATYYLSAWHLYLINSQDTSNSYETMIRLYSDLFDVSVLKAMGLPLPKTQPNGAGLFPTHVTLNLMLNSYFQAKRYDFDTVVETYRRFQRSLQEDDKVVARAALDGPRVYNAFLDAFARLPERDLHSCVRLVAEITDKVTEETVKWSQDGQRWRKKSHIGPDGYSWCILLKVLSGHGQWGACTKILESIRKRYPKSYAVASNTIISAFMKAGKKDEAVQLLQRMMMLGYEVDEHTLRALNYLEKDVSVSLDQTTSTGNPKSESP